ncbi:hypothetical protein [Pseudomonas asiatica]|uniref:hypothetical protein n=1 Tax=Pseudomonas asiatica TaxID=2219225 RepID=UPI003877D4FB
MSAMDEYRAALQRLVSNNTINLPKNSSINKDTVALEAGRKRGSIKKSRKEHAQLILEITAAASAFQCASNVSPTKNIENQKRLKKSALQERDRIRRDYEFALTKIVSLEHENHILRTELNTLKQSNSTPSKVIDLIKP